MTTTSDTQLIEAMFKVSRLMKGNMTFDSKVAHLSMLQIQAMVFLKKSEKAQMGDIAQQFKIELPSATSLISKLSKLKLVRRQADQKDRRIVRIVLTKQGQELLEEAMKERSKKMQENLSSLNAEDKKNLLAIINKLILNMEKKLNEK